MATLNGNGMGEISSQFFLWDLKSKTPLIFSPVLAGILQFVMSLTILPAVENEPEKKPGTKEQKEDVQMATTMQQQMVFMMPIMTIIFWNFSFLQA